MSSTNHRAHQQSIQIEHLAILLHHRYYLFKKQVFLEHPLCLRAYLACLQLNIWQSNWKSVGSVVNMPSRLLMPCTTAEQTGVCPKSGTLAGALAGAFDQGGWHVSVPTNTDRCDGTICRIAGVFINDPVRSLQLRLAHKGDSRFSLL